MTTRNPRDTGLNAGDLHELPGYLLAKASIASDENFRQQAGKVQSLGKAALTILQLIKENTWITPAGRHA